MVQSNPESDIFQIICVPDPVLRARAYAVETIDDDVRAILHKMERTMNAAEGIGLAGNQVNIARRLVVIDLHDGNGPLHMINPEIIHASPERSVLSEGCLSIPGYRADVERPAQVRVSYLDMTGTRQEISGDGLLSACLQHEIDHLNGVLYIDHISRLRRDVILRKLAKDQRIAGAL